MDVIKQKIKCPECGKKTIQQSSYPNYFYCSKYEKGCGSMWVIEKDRDV